MKKEKKEEKKALFGGIKLSWLMVIIGAIVIGVLVGLINCVSSLLDTSFRDPAIYFGFWIFCGIFIIMNSKSNLDSALKCFVFFLISQPLIYLVEVPFVRMGWGIFTYYKYWLIWTILCFPMGFIGYYLKKNKWWGLVILVPMMIFIALEMSAHVGGVLYYFPHHLLSALFCICSLIIYPLCIFKDNKKIRYIGLGIGIVLICYGILSPIISKSYIYETDILCDSEQHPLDEKSKVYLKDSKYGKLEIKEYKGEESFYCVHATFVRAGKTEFTTVDKKGKKTVYELEIKKNTYDREIKNEK